MLRRLDKATHYCAFALQGLGCYSVKDAFLLYFRNVKIPLLIIGKTL